MSDGKNSNEKSQTNVSKNKKGKKAVKAAKQKNTSGVDKKPPKMDVEILPVPGVDTNHEIAKPLTPKIDWESPAGKTIKQELDAFAKDPFDQAVKDTNTKNITLAIEWRATASNEDFVKAKNVRMDMLQREEFEALKRSRAVMPAIADRQRARYECFSAVRKEMQDIGIGTGDDTLGIQRLFRVAPAIKALDKAFSPEPEASVSIDDTEKFLDESESALRNVLKEHLKYTKHALRLATAILRGTKTMFPDKLPAGNQRWLRRSDAVDFVNNVAGRMTKSMIEDEPQKIGTSTVLTNDGTRKKLDLYRNVPNSDRWLKHEDSLRDPDSAENPEKIQTYYSTESTEDETEGKEKKNSIFVKPQEVSAPIRELGRRRTGAYRGT